MQHLVDAARGVAAFGVLAIALSQLIPERFLKPLDVDRYSVAVVGVIAVVLGFALATIFV